VLGCADAPSVGATTMVKEVSSTSTPRAEGRGSDGESRRMGLTPTPVLASEILREVLAPLAPWSRSLRVWDVVFAFVLAAIGVSVHLEILVPTRGGPLLDFVLCGVLLVCAAVPGSYAVRGAGALLVGLLLFSLGLFRVGPLGDWVPPNESAIAYGLSFPAMVVLPAALLLRDRYPQYVGAKHALLIAFVLTLPAIVVRIIVIASGPLAASVAAGVTLGAFALSLVGFMGIGTTGVSRLLAGAIIVAACSERAVRVFWTQTADGGVTDLRAAIVLSIAGALASKGLFMVLAGVLARYARRMDLLRPLTTSVMLHDRTDL